MRLLFLTLMMAGLTMSLPTKAEAEPTMKCTAVRHVKLINGEAQVTWTRRCVVINTTSGHSDTTNPLRDLAASCDRETVGVQQGEDGQTTELKICGAQGSIGSGSKSPRINWAVVMLRAFRATVIPKSKLVIQPPGGKTLINFETLYRTKAKTFTRSLRLLGTRAQLRITPSSYTWVTGAGEQFSTTDPGVAYEESRPMSDYVSYNYEHPAEELHPRVDVTWTAEFRVANGNWRPVQGTVTTTGPESTLKVIEARPVLLSGYN